MYRLDPALFNFWIARSGVTARDISALTGIGESQLSRIKRGLDPIDRAMAEKIAAALLVTVEHLLRGTGERRIATVAP